MHYTLVTALTESRPTKAVIRRLYQLYKAVDTEALTALLESSAPVTVRFEYTGYEVGIDPDPQEEAVTVLE